MRARAARKDQRSDESLMAYLPNHVLTEILSRLPIKTLMVIKSVCRSWLNLVSADTHLAGLHHRRSQSEILLQPVPGRNSTKLYLGTLQFQNDNVSGLKLSLLFDLPHLNVRGDGCTHYRRFVNSCNGFVCFNDIPPRSNLYHDVICNPVTGEFITLPLVPPRVNLDHMIARHGLGFSRKENRYKLLRFRNWWELDQVIRIRHSAEICTLENGSLWRNLGSLPLRFHGPMFTFPYVFLQGRLHFQCRKEEYMDCFDFDDEQFGKVPLPPPSDCDHKRKCIREIGGCLSVTRFEREDCIEIWVMKEYGVKDSWIKAFSIENHCFSLELGPEVYPINGETLIFHYLHHTLALYDSVLNTVITLGSGRTSLEVITYTPTLLPLKDALAGYEACVQNANSRSTDPGVPDWWRPSGC